MPHDYSRKQKAFIKDGRKVTRAQVRGEIDKLTGHVAKESARIAKRLQSGRIDAVEFELQMRQLLKSAHIVAASVGKGGRVRMTQADWGRVGAKIKWQYGYLQKFARKVAKGGISDSMLASRAKSYATSIYTSFMRTYQDAQTEFVADGRNPLKCRLITNSEEGCVECAADEAEGWVSVDDMKPIGSRICGDFCKCDIEFADDEDFDELKINVRVEVEA